MAEFILKASKFHERSPVNEKLAFLEQFLQNIPDSVKGEQPVLRAMTVAYNRCQRFDRALETALLVKNTNKERLFCGHASDAFLDCIGALEIKELNLPAFKHWMSRALKLAYESLKLAFQPSAEAKDFEKILDCGIKTVRWNEMLPCPQTVLEADKLIRDATSYYTKRLKEDNPLSEKLIDFFLHTDPGWALTLLRTTLKGYSQTPKGRNQMHRGHALLHIRAQNRV